MQRFRVGVRVLLILITVCQLTSCEGGNYPYNNNLVEVNAKVLPDGYINLSTGPANSSETMHGASLPGGQEQEIRTRGGETRFKVVIHFVSKEQLPSVLKVFVNSRSPWKLTVEGLGNIVVSPPPETMLALDSPMPPGEYEFAVSGEWEKEGSE